MITKIKNRQKESGRRSFAETVSVFVCTYAYSEVVCEIGCYVLFAWKKRGGQWMANLKETMREGISTEYLQETMMHVIKVLGEPGREYKDRVFRMLLKKPEVALEVYNAMNDTVYENPDELTITTLENAVYMGMKNDVSFVIASQLVLYEHQSTVNKNMPLRNLIYVTCIYSALTRNENLYGRKRIPLPEPKFVVFYNGREKIPDRTECRLSDAYERISGEPDLDLKITILNINEGHNKELAEKSPTLHEYMLFVDMVRKYQDEMEFGQALELAVDECIHNGILRDFLKQNRAEVLRMSIFEYDQEEHIRQEREESWEEGREEGMEQGREEGRIEGIEQGRTEGKEEGTLLKLVQLTLKKIQKGCTPEKIADMFEEDLSMIKKICDIAKKYEPDYQESVICAEMLLQKK